MGTQDVRFSYQNTSMSSTILSLTVNSASMSLQSCHHQAMLLTRGTAGPLCRRCNCSPVHAPLLSSVRLLLRYCLVILISRPDKSHDIPARALSIKDRAPNRSCTFMERIGIALGRGCILTRRHGMRSPRACSPSCSPATQFTIC